LWSSRPGFATVQRTGDYSLVPDRFEVVWRQFEPVFLFQNLVKPVSLKRFDLKTKQLISSITANKQAGFQEE